MDDGGDYVEAQTGPVSDDLLEAEPLTRIRVAEWCLCLSICIVIVVSGIVYLFISPVDSNGVPIPRRTLLAYGVLHIVLGSGLIAMMVNEVVHGCRRSREVDTMTRRHVLPVSRP